MKLILVVKSCERKGHESQGQVGEGCETTREKPLINQQGPNKTPIATRRFAGTTGLAFQQVACHEEPRREGGNKSLWDSGLCSSCRVAQRTPDHLLALPVASLSCRMVLLRMELSKHHRVPFAGAVTEGTGTGTQAS